MTANQYVIVRDEDFLAHHGVKGQKWGVRRYQNEDGSLTAEGKAKYYNEDGSYNKKGAKEAARIEKWKNSTQGQRMINRWKDKGYSESSLYGIHKSGTATFVGTLLGGPLVGITAGLVSNHRYKKSGEAFARTILNG